MDVCICESVPSVCNVESFVDVCPVYTWQSHIMLVARVTKLLPLKNSGNNITIS